MTTILFDKKYNIHITTKNLHNTVSQMTVKWRFFAMNDIYLNLIHFYLNF